MDKTKLLSTIDTARIVVLGVFALIFPLLFTTVNTDAFFLPKELLFTAVVLLSLLLWGAKMILSEKVTLRRTPFDVPVGLFVLALLLSSLFSVNRFDSLLATVPVLLAGLSVFVTVNLLKKEHTIVFFLSALLIGGAATAVLAVFSYFKVYPLLFAFTHTPSFTPLGSLLDQALYLVFLLPVGISLALPILKGTVNNKTITFAVLTLLMGAGLLVTLLQLFTTQQPILLPFETGFQTAFAAISQDTGRIAQGFLFGSGYGTFPEVFTRFKQATFNSNPHWFNVFTQSSSFILEILATTGILGMLSFLFLLFRVVNMPSVKKTNPLYVGLVLLALTSLVLPFSFVEIGLLFLLLGIFAGVQGLKNHKQYYDVELKLVALKKGVINFEQVSVPSSEKHEYNRPTAVVVAIVLLAVVGFIGWFGTLFLLSDLSFQQSLVLASQNNGTGTYKDQVQAITTFPYRSIYYRIFSQTNIALASSLLNVQPKNSSPSAQVQSTMLSLIQQGISSGKQATSISPLTAANWQNLSSVYRSLFGLGQNAETFAIQAAQQAIIVDPTNPQEFIALGGIYYQLGQYDNAIRAFQQAATLKPDYSNAYYNLGHAYEQKGDYQDAMSAYQAVKTLVANDKTNLDKVNADIAALQAKMGAQNQTAPTPTQPAPKVTPAPKITQQPLNLSGQENGPAGSSASPQAPSPAQ